MKLPCVCTYEKLRRLLELGYTVETRGDDFVQNWRPNTLPEAIALHLSDGEQITAIHPPKFKRYEVGDEIWYKGETTIVERVESGDMYGISSVYSCADVHHFDLLPYIEEEEEHLGSNMRWDAPGFEEDILQLKGLPKKIKADNAVVEIDGKKYRLTPIEDE